MLGSRNLFLIGPMGSGKTAVGRCLAKLLHVRFLDSDTEIERRTGVDIRYIFEREGESGFRVREREAIEALTALDAIVLATGGGAILEADNRRLLATNGFVAYLETSVAQQVERVRHGRNRPLLANTDPGVRLAELLEIRAPLYREIADLIVTTDGRKVQRVADEIAHAFKAANPAGGGG